VLLIVHKVDQNASFGQKGDDMSQAVKMNREEFSVFRKISNGAAIAVHGQVFTRPHVVDFILDLAGYTSDKPLHGLTLLEPGAGDGAFLTRAASRLLESSPPGMSLEALSPCLLGVEKDTGLAERTRTLLVDFLVAKGVKKATAKALARAWVLCADFLEMPSHRQFDFIVGNPPYVRQEAIPKEMVEEYRKRFSCFYDRADLYVVFFERSLELLSEKGTLAFICPNRFTKNNYGRKLRQKISQEFKLTHVVDIPEASPFEPEVLSYPGIYVIQRGETECVEHLLMKHASPEECKEALVALKKKEAGVQGSLAYHRYESWFTGEAKWATHSPEHLSLMRRLEAEGVQLGTVASGCKVGIGVATGADDIFIVTKDQVDVEQELLLPLVMTKDIASGELRWQGKYLIDPFDRDDSGRLIDLKGYPKVKRYFEANKERLSNRNVGKRNPTGWYRTIDRVRHKWTNTPMLLIPDIKSSNVTIALKEGSFYPHHNLYFVTSEYWDLRVLRAILRSSIARFFVFMYGVRMRNGYYRFQAQYLRRICLPWRMSFSGSLAEDLAAASDKEDAEKVDSLLARMYRLSRHEASLLRSIDEATQPGGGE
jgi:adenine-specific DNA-methyltransferase